MITHPLAMQLMEGQVVLAEPWEFAAAMADIEAALAAGSNECTVERIQRTCKSLNSARQFGLTRQLALTWRELRGFDSTIVKHEAQALINLAALDQAAALLKSAIDTASQPGSSAQARVELPKYQGLEARVFKQRFVNEGSLDLLEQAFIRYLVQFRNPRRPSYWHGINAVALLARAEREGHLMPSNEIAGAATSESLAREVLAQLDAIAVTPGDEPYVQATYSEAFLALRDYDKSELSLTRMMHHARCTPFMLESYERQLREIWQAGGNVGQSAHADLLATLLARHQMTSAARLSMSPARADGLRSARPSELERNFSGAGSFTVGMIQQMLGACASIGCVCSKDGARLGTGFLIESASIGAPVENDVVFVTNAHVLSDTVRGAIPLSAACVSFELLPGADGRPVYFDIDELLYTSPPAPLGHCCKQTENLDVTIVTLKRLPAQVAGLSASGNLPPIDGRSKAYVIGHPHGSGLQVSVHDSILLASDEQRRLVHYRTPTDPGSSGSPVFDEQWRVIALHHGGSHRVPCLKPASGVYPANEGVTLAAIRNGLGATSSPRA